jgi:hypothetical protein
MTKIIGDAALQNTQIVTTMWDRVTDAEGSYRLEQLSKGEDMFKPALDKNAGITRHNNTYEMAEATILNILNNSKPPFELAIQKELVDENKELPQTGAGIEVDKLAAELIKKHQEEVAELDEEKEEASQGTAARKQLEEEAARLREQMQRTDGERRTMQMEYTRKREEVGGHYQRYQELEKEKVALQEQVRALEHTTSPIVSHGSTRHDTHSHPSQPSGSSGQIQQKRNSKDEIRSMRLKIQYLEEEIRQMREWPQCVIC